MTAPSILYIGLPPNSTLIPKSANIDRDALDRSLQQTVRDCISAGFDTVLCVFDPQELELFENKLKERKWDAVITGFGVRGQPGLTAHFEKVVNLVREHDASIKLGFNSYPSDTVDAARRLFPDVKPVAA
ncbi:hypothetical protein TWF696_000671 [Orbilia brochopaga]|uniref:Uncharacterized protein n=1 Tax=Orbilia brochopaga TaxID=3140254 RepID=A0AAV9VIB9_9PEZI